MNKRLQQIAISASAVSVLAFSALAQDSSKPKREQREDNHRRTEPGQVDHLNGAAKASDILGMTVNNYQNEKLGKVEEIAVDVESGRVLQVILSIGGFIGIGDTLTAVPPGALHHDAAKKVLHLQADKEMLKSAPKFEMSNWAECGDSNHLSEVYRHYGQEPAFRFIQKGDVALDVEHKTDDAPKTVSATQGDNSLDRLSSENRSMIPVSRLGQVQKASKLIGTSVKNLQDEKLGKVENILVDLPSGRVLAVIISSGGFLGMGDELSAVPPTALRFTSDRDNLQLDASKEMLSNAPHFKANQWPEFSEPTYAYGIYRAYRVEPYFTTNATTTADNTERNVRDRHNQTLTPFDQGSSKADVETTAQIRKEIIAGKDLSVNARNVKIITNNGQVTLRGPVNTDEEKRLIGDIAIKVARLENVDNQLEVK